MPVFPQLRSGAVAQLPLQRSEAYRTLRNDLSDGRGVRMADGGFASAEWVLQYADLTLDEVAALRTLFETVEGRLGSLTFVDPSANLLLWSDELTNAVWVKGPQLALAPAVDAFGGQAGWRISNGSAASQVLSQTVGAPGALTYCMSAYLRGDPPCEVNLLIGGASAVTAHAGREWRRWEAASTGGSSGQVEFGLSVPAATAVEACGLQVEAQPGAGVYKSTKDASGVFANSRFDQDSLEISQTAMGLFGCTVRVVSRI